MSNASPPGPKLPPPTQIVRLYETRIFYTIKDDRLCVGTTIAEIGLDSKEKEVFSEPCAAAFPLTHFQNAGGGLDEDLIQSFCSRLAASMVNVTLNQALFHDVAHHILACATLLARRMKIITEGEYEDVEPRLTHLHARSVMARLRAMMGQQTIGSGRHARWTKEALSLAIIVAMRKIKNPARRTQTEVAEKLSAEFPEKFDGGKEGLKKLVARYDLDWVNLKKHADDNDLDLLLSISPELDRFFTR